MIINEFIHKKLGQVCYILASKNEAVIIDPLRKVDEYVEFLEENNLRLKYIINTHPHADFIAGNLELREIFKESKIVFFKDTPLSYDFLGVKEGDVLELGSIKIKILETPGHTPYCISLLVSDEIDKFLFSGDFLFVGDIGRSDLLGEEKLEELIEKSFNSAKKIANLRNDIIILPSHIEGSFCGKNLGSNFFSSIGIEKKTNRVFKFFDNINKYFSLLKTDIETPEFLKKIASLNLKGPVLINELKEPKQIAFNEIDKIEYDFIIDFRHPNCFKSNYIKGSINIYERANYLIILGSLIDIDSKIVLAGSINTNFRHIIDNLRIIGFDNIVGIIKEDINELKLSPFINDSKEVLDLEKINLDAVKNLNKPYKAVCKSGYKAMAVESYLKRIYNGN